MNSAIERLWDLIRAKPKNKGPFDLQSVVDVMFPGYPSAESLLVEPMTSSSLIELIGKLFDPPQAQWSTQLEVFYNDALGELQGMTSPEEFAATLHVAARAFTLCASAHFPTLVHYNHFGDFKKTRLNLFHPIRMLALSSFAADLAYKDFQVKYGCLAAVAGDEKLQADTVYSFIRPKAYHLNVYHPLYMSDPSDGSGEVKIQPDLGLVERFMNARHVKNDLFLTPDDWIGFDSNDLAAHASVLSDIYPSLDVSSLIQASSVTCNQSLFCKFE